MWAKRAAALILGALVLGQTAWGCSSQGNEPTLCSSDSDCGAGQVCGTTSCQGLMRCIPSGCACTEGPGYIVAPGDACLTAGPPACNCDQATCAHPYDSCGKNLCPGVCGVGESCAFCLNNVDACTLVAPCLASLCIPNSSGTDATCRPIECLGSVEPPLCGSPDAPCGEQCCSPDCSGRVCGDDPLCGVSCGVCEGESFCIDGQCQLDPGYPLCAGDLRATPPEVAIDDIAGPLPTPLGGVIADGIYDLTSIRRTVPDAFAEIYLRAALRFSNGGTVVEQAYDANPAYSADYDTPHRLMNVVSDGTVLHFTVTCPDTVLSFDRQFDRGFTVQGSELWLIQSGLMEIYTRRP